METSFASSSNHHEDVNACVVPPAPAGPTDAVSVTVTAEEELVILDWKQVASMETTNAMLQSLERSLGPQGLGLVAIRHVPNFVTAKQSLFSLIHCLANHCVMSSKSLETDYLTHAESLYNTGWSHGKEKLVGRGGGGGKPDLAKGSFYYNPMTDTPGTLDDRMRYPLAYPPNLWPHEEEQEPQGQQQEEHEIKNGKKGKDKMPYGFKQKAQELGCILKNVVTELSKHIDALAQQKVQQKQQQQPNTNNHNNDNYYDCNYPPLFLYNLMKNTEKVKARLLYYFPLEKHEQQEQDNKDMDNNSKEKQDTIIATSTIDEQETIPPQQVAEDSWIGWHADSGFLTALAGDWYIDHDTGEPLSSSCPDPCAGLYVLNRQHQSQRIVIPDDCVAVQIGECTQIITGGTVVATPHCVRGVDVSSSSSSSSSSSGGSSRIARIAVPCFVDTPPDFCLSVPTGLSRQDVLEAMTTTTTSSTITTTTKTTKNGFLQPKIPPLGDRWTYNGQTFGDFLQQTFSLYYEWNNPS